jgi:hypothetical protein
MVDQSTRMTSCAGSASKTEATFHQLSPYIGKIKSSIACSLVSQFSVPGELVYDPFSGCGTVALEAWTAGRSVIANDLSPYALLLTRAKLFPYTSVSHALADLERLREPASLACNSYDLRSVPTWVREFFHNNTLREILGWRDVLYAEQKWFLLACLLGILHHQRPGFLSFPSSHTVPYLRAKSFPKNKFPHLYGYRAVYERLIAKVQRAFRRVPNLDVGISRTTYLASADELVPAKAPDVILTSPPYMRQLDYGRDNRLRLWFLGCDDWHRLDRQISPTEERFLALMRRCFVLWRELLRRHGRCVLVVGDGARRSGRNDLPAAITRIATLDAGFTHLGQSTDRIPNERRVRRGLNGSASETVLVLANTQKVVKFTH